MNIVIVEERREKGDVRGEMREGRCERGDVRREMREEGCGGVDKEE